MRNPHSVCMCLPQQPLTSSHAISSTSLEKLKLGSIWPDDVLRSSMHAEQTPVFVFVYR